MHKILFILFLFFFGFSAGNAQSLTLKVNGIRNTKGQLQVALFKNAQQFQDEKPFKVMNFPKDNISGGRKTIKINLAKGTYGITVLDDEDKSNDMTFRLGVYPLEGVGFSNHELKGMRKPKFDEFSFEIEEGERQMKIELKYF